MKMNVTYEIMKYEKYSYEFSFKSLPTFKVWKKFSLCLAFFKFAELHIQKHGHFFGEDL